MAIAARVTAIIVPTFERKREKMIARSPTNLLHSQFDYVSGYSQIKKSYPIGITKEKFKYISPKDY